jgi:hypothetical protein
MSAMRLSRALVISSVLFLVAACGTIVHPRIGGTDPGRSGGIAPDGRPGPTGLSAPGRTGRDNLPLIQQVCRAQPVPRGWIAIAYTAAGEACPPRTIPGDPYNAAVIEYHQNRVVGTELLVCADQPVPSGWIRLAGRESDRECPGARVSEGHPTVHLIRRIRG